MVRRMIKTKYPSGDTQPQRLSIATLLVEPGPVPQPASTAWPESFAGLATVGPVPGRRSLRMTFQACGITYRGRASNAELAVAEADAIAIRDAVDAHLVAAGLPALLQTVRRVHSNGCTATPRADIAMLREIAIAVARAAPRAVAELGIGMAHGMPPWTARPWPDSFRVRNLAATPAGLLLVGGNV